jgi:hypothetical protein
VPPSETPRSEASASIKMPPSDLPLSQAPRSEASASSGVPFSETPALLGDDFVVLPRAGGRGHRVLVRNEKSVDGHGSSRQRQRGFGQQRGIAQQDADVARGDFARRKRTTNES